MLSRGGYRITLARVITSIHLERREGGRREEDGRRTCRGDVADVSLSVRGHGHERVFTRVLRLGVATPTFIAIPP